MVNRTLRLRVTNPAVPVPVNIGVPTFAGTTAVGQTLASTTGTWSNSPTGYAYQHQSSVDGSTWADIDGATASTLLIAASLEGLYLRPGVVASNATGPAEAYAYGEAVGPVSAAVAKLVPSAQWGATGVAGSGYGTANPAAPTDPTRTTAKPAAQLLIVPRQSYGADFDLIVNARAKGGIASVVGETEAGDEVTVTTPGFHIVADANGNSTLVYGYKFTLGWSETMALNALGYQHVYFTVTANDETMQQRVIGPFKFAARNPGVGTGCVVDKQIFVQPSLATDVTDERYNTITKARQRCVAHSLVNGAASPAVAPVWEFPEIVLTETADYPLSYTSLTESFARETWTIVSAASGVTATIGDGSINPSSAGWQYDALCFRGSGVKIDLAKLSPNLAGFRLRTNSNKLLWFDGCEIFCGDNTCLLGTGSGMGALYDGVTSSGYWVTTQNSSTPNLYFTDVNAHDLPGYGLSFGLLVRGGSIDGVGGSTCENVLGAVHNHTIRRIGGILSGLRTYLDAMWITGPTGSRVVITGNVGSSSRRFQLYDSGGTQVLNLALSTVLPVPPSVTPSTTKVAAVVAAVNALSGFAAGEYSQDRAACFLTLESYGNAGPLGSGSSAPNSSTVSLSATPLVLATFIDVHADAVVYHGSNVVDLELENCIVDFLQMEELVAGNMIGLNSNCNARDVYFGQWTCQDTSASYGESISGGYISSEIASHVVMEYISQAAGTQSLTVTFEPDAYCHINHCHLAGLLWSTRASGIYPTLDIEGLSVPAGNGMLPQGSDANSKLQPEGLDDGAFFTDLTDAANPDFRPLSPLELDDGTYAGALAPATGNWQGVTY